MTDAHTTTEHETLVYNYPAHEPRESDPHYAIFNATRKRLAKLGALKCWIGNDDCDHAHPIELHHSIIEFSLTNIVDRAKFGTLYPEFHILSDEDLLALVESEGNLTPLCVQHHRGLLGIHSIHYPAWLCQRFMKTGVPVPEMKQP